MESSPTWQIIFKKKFKRLLPLDVENCSPIALRHIVLDVNTPASILDSIAQTYSDDEDLMRDLIRCHNLDEVTLAFIALTGSEELKSFITGTRVMDLVVYDPDAAAMAVSSPEEIKPAPGEKKKLNLTQLVIKMNPSQKIKLAITGAKEARTMLIRESSKMIALAVLANPRLTIGEVEFFAKSTNLSEDVVRKIGSNAEWSKKSTIVSALVNNPKTPVSISLGFVNRLTERELGSLEKSRNIPAALKSAARSHLMKKKMGKG